MKRFFVHVLVPTCAFALALLIFRLQSPFTIALGYLASLQMPPPMPMLLRRQSSIGMLRDALSAMCDVAGPENANALRILHLLLKKVSVVVMVCGWGGV